MLVLQFLMHNCDLIIVYSGSVKLEQQADNLELFNQCMELCRQKNVKVIFVVTPIPERTILKWDGLETVRGWYAAAAAENGCEFYDFNLIRTRTADYPADTAFFDGTHLSSSGAQTFTAAFCDVLQRVAAGEDVSDLFYADYEELDSVLSAQQ